MQDQANFNLTIDEFGGVPERKRTADAIHRSDSFVILRPNAAIVLPAFAGSNEVVFGTELILIRVVNGFGNVGSKCDALANLLEAASANA
jgi:hypothetical protein